MSVEMSLLVMSCIQFPPCLIPVDRLSSYSISPMYLYRPIKTKYLNKAERSIKAAFCVECRPPVRHHFFH